MSNSSRRRYKNNRKIVEYVRTLVLWRNGCSKVAKKNMKVYEMDHR